MIFHRQWQECQKEVAEVKLNRQLQLPEKHQHQHEVSVTADSHRTSTEPVSGPGVW